MKNAVDHTALFLVYVDQLHFSSTWWMVDAVDAVDACRCYQRPILLRFSSRPKNLPFSKIAYFNKNVSIAVIYKMSKIILHRTNFDQKLYFISRFNFF